jgi:hypothetical protein
MSPRKLAALVAVLAAGCLVYPAAAAAQSSPTATHATSFTKIPVTGTGKNGKHFSGQFTVDKFVRQGGRQMASGTLTGHLGHRFVSRSDVLLPVQVVRGGSASAAKTCPILHLVLGPLNLNLLGLKVHLNRVVLDITAQSGPGNLLGNLLCSVANLLNGPSLLGSQINGLLNILHQLINVPLLLNL